MNNKITEIKYQTSNLCYALLRNINDNFISVSFDFAGNKDVLVKVILAERTIVEEDYIYDMSVEFSAIQERDCVRSIQIEVGKHHLPLKNLVYQKAY